MSDSVEVVCPHCATINRVPGPRLGESPQCGHCHRSLFTGSVLEPTAADFRRHVARNGIDVLVDFWAPWCGPCQVMAPQYVQAAAQLEPQLRLAKLNTEAEPALAAEFAIRSIPTLVLFRRGRELARHSGALSSADIVRWVQAQR